MKLIIYVCKQCLNLALGIVFLQVFSLPAQALDVVDPPQDHTMYHHVLQAIEEFKVLDLYPDHTFQGQRAFTRYELADALFRVQNYVHLKYQVQINQDARGMSIVQAYLKPLGDIPQRHWALAAIGQSMALGLLNGDSQLKFYGPMKVSRYQLAQSIYQIFDWLQIHPIVTRQYQKAADLNQSHWAAEAVREVLVTQIMQTDPSGHFHGERAASRQELADALVRVMQQIELVALKDGLHPKEVIPLPGVLIHKRMDGRNPPLNYAEED